MPNLRYLSGARAERLLKRELESKGYLVTRSAGSKGKWDLISVWPGGLVQLIQVKGLKRGVSHTSVRKEFNRKAIARGTGYLQYLYVRQNQEWHIYGKDRQYGEF